MNGTAMINSLPMTWARRVTLVVGVPLAVTLIGWTAFHFVAEAGQGSYPVSYRIPVHAGQVSAHINGGDVTLRLGSGNGAWLTGTVHYSLIRPSLTAYSAADGTKISFDCQVPAGNCGLDATLNVPARTAVSMSSGGGNLSVSGLASDVTLSTGGGDLAADGLTGHLRLSTGGGDIDGSALAAPYVTAHTGGGDITLTFTRPPASVLVTSGGGDVTIVLPHGDTAYDVRTRTDGGDITDAVPVSTSSPNAMTVTSSGGDVAITEAS
jgi:Toastrack DUF4097